MDKNKLLIISGLSGATAYFAHEELHSLLGSTAYAEVSAGLAVVAVVGLYLQEIVTTDDVNNTALTILAIGAGTFGFIHQASHGELILDTALNQSSYILAGVAALGAYLHEDLSGRIDFVTD
jgi:hypothetical protein